jgi:hypothetical protein
MSTLFCVGCQKQHPVEYMDQSFDVPSNIDKTQPLPPWSTVSLGQRAGVYHYAYTHSKECAQKVLQRFFGLTGLK